MSINGFDFPKVTLRQEFQSTGPGTVDELGVVCIGPVYQYNAGEEPLTGVGLNASTLVLTGTLPYAERLDGTVDNGDTVIRLEQAVLEYGSVDDDISYSGTEVTLPVMSVGGRALSEGDYVALYADVSDSVPAGVFPVSSVDSYEKGRWTVSYTNTGAAVAPVKVGFCVCDDAEVRAASGVSVSSEFLVTVQPTATAEISTGLYGYVKLVKVTSGTTMYVKYRVKDAKSGTYLGSVSSLSDVEAVLGPVSKRNPVALGCTFALSAGGGTVYFIGVADPSSTSSWGAALDYLDRYNNLYSVVPCWPDADSGGAIGIVQKCFASVDSVSSDIESKVWRTLWYGISCTSATSTAADEKNALIASKQARTRSYRAQCVFADEIEYDGESLFGHNYAAAAAAAGMRAGQPCHRPLSNLSYSFFSVKEPHGFTRTQLRALGAEGIWIIANNEDGAPTNLRQVTTAVANNLNMDEESIVANADNIAINMAQVGRELVGCSNISPDLLLALADTIRNRMDLKLVNTYGAYIGPQILEWELIREPYQDPVNLDHVLADFSITPPKPFNQFHMTLIVL